MCVCVHVSVCVCVRMHRCCGTSRWPVVAHRGGRLWHSAMAGCGTARCGAGREHVGLGDCETAVAYLATLLAGAGGSEEAAGRHVQSVERQATFLREFLGVAKVLVGERLCAWRWPVYVHVAGACTWRGARGRLASGFVALSRSRLHCCCGAGCTVVAEPVTLLSPPLLG